jgi:hypothetical protein
MVEENLSSEESPKEIYIYIITFCCKSCEFHSSGRCVLYWAYVALI